MIDMHCEIKNHTLILDRAAFRSKLALETDGKCRLRITSLSKRTLGQNGLYWLRNEILAEHTMPENDLHAYLMQKCGFGQYRKIIPSDERETFVRISSTDLSPAEFSALMKEQDKLAMFLEMELPREKDITNSAQVVNSKLIEG